ncbi:F-box protein At2g26850-like [Apium graveolens]|uniref:F-box protein At2g26850-like n=1 Tax=Apium graveolens TaxID=4045 RepID=UPI003D79DEEC
MFLLLISCFSFIMFNHISFLNSFMEMKNELRTILVPWILEALSLFIISLFKRRKILVAFFKVPTFSSKPKNEEIIRETSLLDLPDLALDCILEKLSPAELCNMASVCTSLRNVCVNDYFWEKHLKHKWVRVIGDIAYREWKSNIALKKKQALSDCSDQNGIFRLFSFYKLKMDKREKLGTALPLESIMSLYQSLESGKFWFPGQVINRENGNVGFMLSCYDAELCYDHRSNNFRARYSAQGRATMEHDIEWDRIRASTVKTPAHDLHLSDCLGELQPGDHIEIQWRRNNDFPYGWWYGVVGHLGSCDGCKLLCRCHSSDAVVLEFKQYTPGSRWRETIIDRKHHTEIGDEINGFYGGIRKIKNKDEISMWKGIWPTKVVE